MIVDGTRLETRAAIVAVLLTSGAGVALHGTTPAATICDALAAKIRTSSPLPDGRRDAFSIVTAGTAPIVEIAAHDAKNMQLGPDPAADERVQAEKRLRARFGQGDALLKRLRDWTAFDVMSMPGTNVYMALMTSGPAGCETRLFFRTTLTRETELIADPPAAPETPDATCQNWGSGYFARINRVEALLEDRPSERSEAFRIVPLVNYAWQAACTFEVPRVEVAGPIKILLRSGTESSQVVAGMILTK